MRRFRQARQQRKRDKNAEAAELDAMAPTVPSNEDLEPLLCDVDIPDAPQERPEAVFRPRRPKLRHTWLRECEVDDCLMHYWIPRHKEEPPRGLVVLFHGLGGHAMYPTVKYLAELLVKENFCVYAGDFCGHGHSRGLRGYIESPEVLLRDAKQMIVFAMQRHQDLSLFLGGVSLGGAVALLLSIELKSSVAGLLLLAPMVSLDLPKWQRLALKRLHRVSKTMVLFKPPPNYVDYQFRDPERKIEAEADQYIYRGRVRIASALTCVRVCKMLQKQIEDISAPFLVLMALEDYVVDNAGIDDLVERASSTDKTLKEYEALHGLLCEEQPLRGFIETDIVNWIKDRSMPEI
jgi:acylglycerol lipase